MSEKGEGKAGSAPGPVLRPCVCALRHDDGSGCGVAVGALRAAVSSDGVISTSEACRCGGGERSPENSSRCDGEYLRGEPLRALAP
jgi:hypothetical protein